MSDKHFERVHKGRFSGSSLGCPRAQALHILGYTPTISSKLREKFDEGKEHDAEMKLEAEEEFEDFRVPGTTIIKLKRGDTEAEISLTPDGLRDNEVVEFKSLSPSIWNSLRTEEDFIEGSPLLQKYYNQVQSYAGAFKKKYIRFRLRNKRNLKTKDIVFKSNPSVWEELKQKILDIKEMLDRGELPPKTCDSKEEKRCLYRIPCRRLLAQEIEETEEKEFTKQTKSLMSNLTKKYLSLKAEKEEIEMEMNEVINRIKELMKEHGKKEEETKYGFIKYGVRYKQKKNTQDIKELVEKGLIRIEEVPEEYCTVYPRGEEK